MQSKLMIVAFAAAAIALPTVAGATGQTESKGMSSRHVGKATHKMTSHKMTSPGVTTGANMGTSRARGSATSTSRVSPADSHAEKTGEKLRGQ
jgi:hypothetical protein